MSERTVPDPADSPAALLGPVALFFGAVAALAWAPGFFLLAPLTAIAGVLALTFGAAGVHYARRGVGRLWVSVAGTLLGLVGFLTFAAFVMGAASP